MTKEELLSQAKAIVERCAAANAWSDQGKYEWPDGALSHCVGCSGDGNEYAEPEGAVCRSCVEALLKLIEEF